MKKIIALILSCAIVLSMLTACGNSTSSNSNANNSASNSSDSSNKKSQEVTKLSFSHHDAATSVWGVYFEEWADEVDASGLTDTTVYAGATLAAPADGLNALRTGVCDILWTNMAFYSGQFPVTEATILPMLNNGATAEEATQVFWDLWENEEMGQALRDEWSEFKILIMHGSPAFPIGLTNAGSTPDDIAGRTLRTPAGGLTELMNEIGANPVLTPSGDIYTSMDKGIIEGYHIDYAGIAGFKLDECTNYALDLGTINIFMIIAMTQEKFDSLPADVQAALEGASGREASVEFAKRTDEAADEMRATFAADGRLITPTDAEMKLWQEAAQPVHENWIKNNTSDTFDAQAFYDYLADLFLQYTT